MFEMEYLQKMKMRHISNDSTVCCTYREGRKTTFKDIRGTRNEKEYLFKDEGGAR